jgi:hypothetical protein
MHGPSANLLSPRTFLTLLRVLWLAMAVTMGLALRDAGPIVAVVWWATVAAVVIALVVPAPAGLTGLRVVSPVVCVAAVIALALGAPSGWGVGALAVSFLAAAVAFSAETGEAMVQGAAYGQEQRFPLRVPAPVLLPMALAWLLWAAALVGGVLLLRHHDWAAGCAVAAVAAGLSWLLAKRFHRLSRRWLVVVPAGVVLHDHLVLGETLMVQRQNVAAAELALADTQAADLSGPAAGNAVEITVRDTVLAVFPSSKEHPTGRAIHMQSFLVSPTRPGRAIKAITGR